MAHPVSAQSQTGELTQKQISVLAEWAPQRLQSLQAGTNANVNNAHPQKTEGPARKQTEPQMSHPSLRPESNKTETASATEPETLTGMTQKQISFLADWDPSRLQALKAADSNSKSITEASNQAQQDQNATVIHRNQDLPVLKRRNQNMSRLRKPRNSSLFNEWKASAMRNEVKENIAPSAVSDHKNAGEDVKTKGANPNGKGGGRHRKRGSRSGSSISSGPNQQAPAERNDKNEKTFHQKQTSQATVSKASTVNSNSRAPESQNVGGNVLNSQQQKAPGKAVPMPQSSDVQKVVPQVSPQQSVNKVVVSQKETGPQSVKQKVVSQVSPQQSVNEAAVSQKESVQQPTNKAVASQSESAQQPVSQEAVSQETANKTVARQKAYSPQSVSKPVLSQESGQKSLNNAVGSQKPPQQSVNSAVGSQKRSVPQSVNQTVEQKTANANTSLNVKQTSQSSTSKIPNVEGAKVSATSNSTNSHIELSHNSGDETSEIGSPGHTTNTSNSDIDHQSPRVSAVKLSGGPGGKPALSVATGPDTNTSGSHFFPEFPRKRPEEMVVPISPTTGKPITILRNGTALRGRGGRSNGSSTPASKVQPHTTVGSSPVSKGQQCSVVPGNKTAPAAPSSRNSSVSAQDNNTRASSPHAGSNTRASASPKPNDGRRHFSGAEEVFTAPNGVIFTRSELACASKGAKLGNDMVYFRPSFVSDPWKGAKTVKLVCTVRWW